MKNDSLERFAIIVSFDDEGELGTITYFDEKGCGHMQDVPRPTVFTAQDLANLHIGHYASEHGVEPWVRCTTEAVLNGFEVRCDEHYEHSGSHRFTLVGGR